MDGQTIYYLVCLNFYDMICLAVNSLEKKKSIHFIFQIWVFFFIFKQTSSFKWNRYSLKKKKATTK